MSNKNDDAQPHWPGDSGMNAVLAAWSHHRARWTAAINAQRQGAWLPGTGSLGVEGQQPGVEVTHPELLIPASILNLGDRTTEGQLIEAVALPWFEILKELERDPQFLHQLCWRRVEELVAGAYKREGWPEVILTPRSGDRGRDIIASKPGVGAVRIIDQVKAYSPGHKVTAGDVRELCGVLARDPNVSKGIVTTTATFAPGVHEEWKEWTPFRLELKDGPTLTAWLVGLRGGPK